MRYDTIVYMPCQNNLSYLNSENNIRGIYTPVCPPPSLVQICINTDKALSCLFIVKHDSNVITVEK